MKKTKIAAEPSIEEQLKRMEELARMLDVGTAPLDQQLKAYEEIVSLARGLRAYLSAAELRVRELAASARDNNTREDPQEKMSDD